MSESQISTQQKNQNKAKSKINSWKDGSKRNLESTLKASEIPNIRDETSALGPEWCGIFEIKVEFQKEHYITAMENLIKNPNINSTVILRADILKEFKYTYSDNGSSPSVETYINENPEELLLDNDFKDNVQSNEENASEEGLEEEKILTRDLNDLKIKQCPLTLGFKPLLEAVRRIIPRNPSKDYIINQTCLIMENEKEDAILIVYSPHITNSEETPFYLPAVKSIGLLYKRGTLSIHYLPFESQSVDEYKTMNPTERPIRIAYRLVGTAKKHSMGVMNGYQKRVNHDLVVSKVTFQDRYIKLKQKYAKALVDNWSESTDPRKHVFEDIAIAAFLIEFWNKIYEDRHQFEFRDLGCGNGLLCYILIMEGYRGVGIDARARKSWLTYPPQVQSCLQEQLIIPSTLLRPHPSVSAKSPNITDNGVIHKVPVRPIPPMPQPLNNKVMMVECYSSAELLTLPQINTAEFPKNTFVIGNHSDELTCWIPLLGYPFLVIPCCSHNLHGEKIRYPINKAKQASNVTLSYSSNSRYAGLVDHVEDIATLFGWKVEREMLRIPSTRNAAVIGYQPNVNQFQNKSIYEILVMEGGADRWIENTMTLMKRPPRDH